VAVFGTRFVVESDLYGEVRGVEFVRPRAEEIERIHAIYTKLALSGEVSPGQHAELYAIAHELITRDKVDAVLLGGTDLALLFNESNTDFPHVDVAGVHIRAIARKMLEE
jgi:aspartate racemase